MKPPDYLYHYTTLNTAKLILENRTIRFNNLNKTDDVDESMTEDVGIAGRYIFVSCWTDASEENISLWSMYSDGFSGVRIGMRYNPFKNMYDTYPKGLSITDDTLKNDNSEEYRPIIPWEHLFNGRYTCVTPIVSPSKGYDSCIVYYANNKRLLFPKVFKSNGTKISYNLGEVGKYKKREWENQREVRYRIYAVPIKIWDFLKEGTSMNNIVLEGLNKMIKNEDLPISYIDLNIDNEAFNDMEIMIGPKVSDIEREQFIEYVKQKNPNCRIVYSNLNMRKHI